MRLLIVTAVKAEADAIGTTESALVVAGGIGRVNAACAVTQAILEQGPFVAVISSGVAGSLPGSGLNLGDVIVSSACVYAEEGLITPNGFGDMSVLGFPLGDFAGNAVPVDTNLLAAAQGMFRTGRIATVATCSGTNDAALEVVRRTGAVAEAMEGAAVVHAARRLGVPAIELRTVSNTTGDRPLQSWDLPRSLRALGDALREFVRLARAT